MGNSGFQMAYDKTDFFNDFRNLEYHCSFRKSCDTDSTNQQKSTTLFISDFFIEIFF
jgi:hypothetical protein